MKLLPWLGIALIAVGFGANAQGIHKCVGKDGKTSYSNAPCPGSKEVEVAVPPAAAKGAAAKKEPAVRPATTGAAASAPDIPEMQPGNWKVRITRDGRTKENEMCGNPIDGFREEVKSYAANTKWGCSMTTTGSGTRSVNIVYDCPSDRSPEGRPLEKGRWLMSLVSASPQAFRLEMNSTGKSAYVMEGTRIGDCQRR